MITVDELKAMPLDEPIGMAVVCDIECMANEGLQPFYQREFEPYEGVIASMISPNMFPRIRGGSSGQRFLNGVSRCSCCTTILVPTIIVISLLKCFLV